LATPTARRRAGQSARPEKAPPYIWCGVSLELLTLGLKKDWGLGWFLNFPSRPAGRQGDGFDLGRAGNGWLAHEDGYVVPAPRRFALRYSSCIRGLQEGTFHAHRLVAMTGAVVPRTNRGSVGGPAARERRAGKAGVAADPRSAPQTPARAPRLVKINPYTGNARHFSQGCRGQRPCAACPCAGP